jgi:hypothetical protein
LPGVSSAARFVVLMPNLVMALMAWFRLGKEPLRPRAAAGRSHVEATGDMSSSLSPARAQQVGGCCVTVHTCDVCKHVRCGSLYLGLGLGLGQHFLQYAVAARCMSRQPACRATRSLLVHA